MSRKKATWIKLYRGIVNSAVWDDPLRLKVWLYILLETYFQDSETCKRGRYIKVKRGQCLTSLREISQKCNCTPKTVQRILRQFRDDLGMITYQIFDRRYTVITVNKYKEFQGKNSPEGYTDDYTDDHTEDYTHDHTDDYTEDTQRASLYKNDIEDNKNAIKNQKNSPSPSPEGSAVIKKIDAGGPMPEGWNQKLEDSFAENYEANYKIDKEENTRQAWYDFFGGWDEYK